MLDSLFSINYFSSAQLNSHVQQLSMKQMCSYLPPETRVPEHILAENLPQLPEEHLCPLYSRSCNDCLLHGAGVDTIGSNDGPTGGLKYKKNRNAA